MKLIENKADLLKAIGSIETRGKKLDADIHRAAASAIKHVDAHGDVSVVNRLIDAMPKGSRVNALRDYIAAYGKVVYNSETKQFDFNRNATTQLDKAIETSWVEFKPEPEYQPVQINAMIDQMVSKMKRDQKTLGDQSEVTSDHIAALMAIKTVGAEAAVAH